MFFGTTYFYVSYLSYDDETGLKLFGKLLPVHIWSRFFLFSSIFSRRARNVSDFSHFRPFSTCSNLSNSNFKFTFKIKTGKDLALLVQAFWIVWDRSYCRSSNMRFRGAAPKKLFSPKKSKKKITFLYITPTIMDRFSKTKNLRDRHQMTNNGWKFEFAKPLNKWARIIISYKLRKNL